VVLFPHCGTGEEDWESLSIVKKKGREKLTIPGLNYEESLKKEGSQTPPNRYEFNEQASGSD